MLARLAPLPPDLFAPVRHSARSLPLLGRAARAVHRWLERRRQLRALSELDDHLLRDIGLSREDAERECSTGFWRRRPFAGNSAGDRRGSRTNPPATCSP